MRNLHIENKEEIAIVAVNRPDALNALNRETLEELYSFLEKHIQEKSLSGLILTGQGEKSFIAGADIKEMAMMTAIDMLRFCELGQKVTTLLEEAPFATVAAVNGYALGGGLEMALACDFIYAAKHAVLGLPEVSLGIIPGFGGTQRLSRAVGTRVAKELIMSGKKIDAAKALEIKLVNKLCESASLIDESIAIVKEIKAHSSFATAQAKKAVNLGYEISLKEALSLEKNMCAVCFNTKEREAAMEKFLSKGKKNE